MVADDPQHRRSIALVAREGPALGCDFCRCCVGHTGHQRRQTATDRPAFVGIVAQTHGHQQRANVGEAQTQRPVFVGQLGDFLRRELRHQHRRFERQRPQTAGVFVGLDIQRARLAADKLHQVQRCEVTGGIVEEHVLGTGVRRVDPTGLRTGVPLVDGAIVLQTRVCTGPGRKRNLIPEVGCVDRLHHLAGDAAGQVPVLATLDLAEEVVGHAHGVVRVLTRNGQVGVAVPIGVVGRDLDLGEALPRHFDHAVDVVIRHLRPTRFADRLLQRGVGFGIEALVAVHGLAGRHDRLHVLVQVL